MRTIRLTLAYDGTRYLGWQWQPYGPTIQGELQEAVRRLTGESVDVIGSGRTDAGVHALGQVAGFRTSSGLPLVRFLHGLSHHLPGDIVVRDVAEAGPTFHAQFHAKRKRYRYVLCDAPPAHPFLRPYAWFVKGPLDVAAMHEAAQVLVGTHDFLCFETKGPNKATSVRTVLELTVRRDPGWRLWAAAASPPQAVDALTGRHHGSGDRAAPFIAFEIEADGFLWNMVRAIAGTLRNVGRGRLTPDGLRSILESRDRRRAGETAPPQGLYLVNVEYD